MTPLLVLSEEQKAREAARAREVEAAELQAQREVHRMAWQCVALTFLGVPLYAWSWHLTDTRQSAVAASGAILLSYGAPFFRWLFFQLGRDAGSGA